MAKHTKLRLHFVKVTQKKTVALSFSGHGVYTKNYENWMRIDN